MHDLDDKFYISKFTSLDLVRCIRRVYTDERTFGARVDLDNAGAHGLMRNLDTYIAAVLALELVCITRLIYKT